MIINKDLFRPFYPTGLRPHSLFGKQYIKHQFKSVKWQRSCHNEQYQGMIRILRKNLELQKLIENSRSEKARKSFKNLRTSCQNQRQKIKVSLRGDIQRVSILLMEHKEMQRLYQKQDISLANNNIMQRNFTKRKENDRLQYKLGVLSEKYKELLFEESRLKDRIKYEKEYFLQPEEIKASKLRPELDNSKTRIKAFKIINQSYKNMIDTLKKDELHYHPVLDSLEADFTEQANFIQHIILLAIPAKKKYELMIDEYNNMENESREQMKMTIKFLTDTKKNVHKSEHRIKNLVNKKIESYVTPRQYTWVTPSMRKLNEEKEDLYKTIKHLQLTTLSSDPEEVIKRIENCEIYNMTDKELLSIHEKTFDILTDTEERARVMIDSLKYTPTEIDFIETIKNLKSEMNQHKNIRKECNEDITRTGEMVTRLNYALNNLLEVMRHVGKDRKRIHHVYPNDNLKLPLLKFNFVNKIPTPPPHPYNEDRLIELAKEKIKELCSINLKPITTETMDKIKKKYDNLYLDSLANYEKKNIIKDDISPALMYPTRACLDPGILCRSGIKARSAQIVEAERIRREFI